MIAEGFELMLVGMGTVFAFLVFLVGCMKLMGRLSDRLERLFPAEEEIPAAAGSGALAAASSMSSPKAKVAAAVAAAHRARG